MKRRKKHPIPAPTSHNIDISHGIRLALRHPETASSLLAQTFSNLFHNAPWIDKKMKIRFCIMFLSNYLDSGLEKEVGMRLLKRVRQKPIEFGIRMLKRNPEQGLKVLVALVTYELRLVQLFDHQQQREFIEELLKSLFPEFKEADPEPVK